MLSKEFKKHYREFKRAIKECKRAAARAQAYADACEKCARIARELYEQQEHIWSAVATPRRARARTILR